MSDVLWVFAEVSLRTTAVLALGLAGAFLLRRRPAVLRRGVWIATLAATILVPLLTQLGPALPLRILRPSPTPTAAVEAESGARLIFEAAPEEPMSRRPDAPRIPVARPAPAESHADRIGRIDWRRASVDASAWVAIGLWLVGFLGVVARSVSARIAADRLRRAAAPADRALWPAPAAIDVRATDRIELPFTVGAWRAAVLVPDAAAAWPAEWRTMVLAHEIAHVRRRDPLFQVMAELACAMYWFHPLVWVAARQLRIERECVADDDVLRGTAASSRYAELLLDLASTPATLPRAGVVAPILAKGGLKARLLGILDDARPRTISRGGAAALVIVGLAAFAPLALGVPMSRGQVDAPSGSGRLIGRVLDGDSGAPVAGAEVHVLVSNGPRLPRSARVFSDREGWFRYPAGIDVATSFNVYARKGRHAARRPVLDVKYGTQLPITLNLRAVHAIEGTVRNEEGAPVGGARLRFLQYGTTEPGPGYDFVATTDEHGRFRIDGMYYGRYWLLAVAPWGVANTAIAHVVDRDVRSVEITVGREWAVRGWLQDEEGRPVPGVRIMDSIWPPSPETQAARSPLRFVHWDESAKDGSFRLVPRGRTYSVRARNREGETILGTIDDGGERVVRTAALHGAPVATTTLDRRRPGVFTLVRAAHIAGVVSWPDGSPAAGARVVAGMPRYVASPEAGAGEDGRFALGPLHPGKPVIISAVARGQGVGRGNVTLRLSPGEHRDGVVVRLTLPR